MFIVEILETPEGLQGGIEVAEAILNEIKKDIEIRDLAHRPLRVFIAGLDGNDVVALRTRGFKVRVYDTLLMHPTTK